MADILETLQKLPKVCYTQLPSNPNQVIQIRRGVVGYYPIEYHDDIDDAKYHADRLNQIHGVTKAELAAMEAGSIFGWEIPAANPDLYDNNGNMK